MHFPNISEICSKEVVTISSRSTLKEAIDRMIETDHRNIIVDNSGFYHILQMQDVLRFNLADVDSGSLLNQLELRDLPLAQCSENILDAVRFLKEKVEYIGVINDKGVLRGLLTHSDIVNSIDPDILMDNYSISEVLNKHRPDLWVLETESTQEVIGKMVAHDTDCVLALSESNELVGIFTTKDVLRLYENKIPLQRPLSEMMTSPVKTIDISFTVKQAVDFIQNQPFKRVVVLNEEGKLEGMITQRELIALTYNKWAMLMRQFQEELMELNTLLENKSERYKALAAQDPLTGLYNRYKFTEVFATEFLTMQKRENSMSLVMLDVDFFKHINDTYGHNAGDDVLVSISRAILDHQRQIDVVCRWGGEEFLILLPTANLDQAIDIADRLREKIMALDVVEGHRLTASFGVTLVDKEDSLESLVARADDALYQAKESGRNCVVSI